MSKRNENITPEVIRQVDERADSTVAMGCCEDCGQRYDWRGPEYHEPLKQMGGTTRQFMADEVWRLCGRCHSKRHGVVEV